MKAQAKQKLVFSLLSLSMLAVIVPVVFSVIYLLVRGLPGLSWEFVTAMPRDNMRAGGILPAIVGTLYLVLGTVLFALPLGVMSAVYLTEYARRGRVTRLVRLAIVNLAGVPDRKSVV